MPAGPRLTGRAARGAAGVNTGQIISGAGHLALIGWALIGGVFQSAPPPFEVVQATAISEEEFAAIMDRQSAPDAVADVDTPEPPAPGEAAPSLRSEADTPPEAAQPDANEASPPDPAPDVSQITPPAPAEVEDAPPVMEVPQEDVAVMVPEVSPRPQPRPAPRVAPEAVARPEPDVRVDDVASPEVTPDEGAESAEEPSEATAPEEAATEIVTEAEEPAQAAPGAPGGDGRGTARGSTAARNTRHRPKCRQRRAGRRPGAGAADQPDPERPAPDRGREGRAAGVRAALLECGEPEFRGAAHHRRGGRADGRDRQARDRQHSHAERLGRRRCGGETGVRGGPAGDHPLWQ